MKYISNFLVYFVSLCCNAQVENKDSSFLLFKIAYRYDNHYLHGTQTAYCITNNIYINNEIGDMAIKRNPPYLVYYITKHGGYYVPEAFSSLYTYGCCEYGNVSKGISIYIKDSSNILKDYNDENLLKTKLKNGKSVLLKIKDKDGEYVIRVWKVKLDYCVCEIYLESLKHPAYHYNVAYIKHINSIAKFNKEEKIVLKKRLGYIIGQAR